MQGPSDEVLLERTIERVRRQLLGSDWNDDIEVFDPSEEVEEVDLSKEKPTPAIVSGLIDLAERCRWRNLDSRVPELLAKIVEALDAIPADQRASILYHSCLIRVVLLYDYLGRYESADAAATKAQKSVAQLMPTNLALVTLCNILSLGVYQKVGKVAEGRPVFMQVIVAAAKVAELACGPQLLSTVAEVCFLQAKLTEADAMFAEATNALTKKSPGSPKIAQIALLWAPVKRERGRYAECETQLAAAAESLSKAFGPTHRWVARALVQLADIQRVQGKQKLALANALRAVEMLRKEGVRVAGLGQQEVSLAYAILGCCAVQRDVGLVSDAEKALADVDERTRTQLGRTHPLALLALDTRAELLILQGRIGEAEKLLTDALSAAQKRPRGDANELLHVAPLLARLALAYEATGRIQPAQAVLQDAIAMRRKWLPEDHPMLLPLMVINARLTAAMGHGAAAEGLCVRMLGIVRKMLGGDENQLLFAQFLKVKLQTFIRAGQYADALPLSGRILELKKKLLGDDNPQVVSATNDVANCYWLVQKPTEAEPIAQKAVELAKKVTGNDSLLVGECLSTLVKCLVDQKRYQQAEPLAEQAWRLAKKALGQYNSSVQGILDAYISTLDGLDKYEEAIALLKYSFNNLKAQHPQLDHPNFPSLLYQLSLHYWNMDQIEEANQYGEQAVQSARKIFGPDHPMTSQIEEGLSTLQQDSGRGGGSDYDSYEGDDGSAGY